MRPRHLPSTRAHATRRFAGLLLVLSQIAFIVSTAQLFGVAHAAASAWSWLAELQSQVAR